MGGAGEEVSVIVLSCLSKCAAGSHGITQQTIS
jgi:hypothetical protein